jgi:hypothetical protein
MTVRTRGMKLPLLGLRTLSNQGSLTRRITDFVMLHKAVKLA